MSGDWREHAACLGMDPDLFFPPETGGKAQARKAKAVCARCPVRGACLADAMPFGIWGGTAERDRRQPKPASSRYRGVSFNKQLGKYVARGRRDGRQVHLGVFADEDQAADAVAAYFNLRNVA